MAKVAVSAAVAVVWLFAVVVAAVVAYNVRYPGFLTDVKGGTGSGSGFGSEFRAPSFKAKIISSLLCLANMQISEQCASRSLRRALLTLLVQYRITA